MKAIQLVAAAIAVSISIPAFSQDEKTQKMESEKKEVKVSTWGIYPPPPAQVDSSAALDRANHPSFPAPNFGNYYIPVLGSYSSSESNTEKQITITADEKNIGKVWIEGLAPVKIFALLKAAPGTYKIPAQKQAQEGTLIYDDSNKLVNICLGCGYKDKNPTAEANNSQASSKNKSKAVLNFTGVKTDQGTVINK